MNDAFTLSYPVQSVTWDGEKIRRIPDADISRSLDLMQQCGIDGEKLFTTHVHDNHGPNEEVLNSTGFLSPEGIDERLPPGFGTIPWTNVIAKLWRIGYSHPVNFESGPWPGTEAAEGLRSAIRYWRTCEHLAGR